MSSSLSGVPGSTHISDPSSNQGLQYHAIQFPLRGNLSGQPLGSFQPIDQNKWRAKLIQQDGTTKTFEVNVGGLEGQTDEKIQQFFNGQIVDILIGLDTKRKENEEKKLEVWEFFGKSGETIKILNMGNTPKLPRDVVGLIFGFSTIGQVAKYARVSKMWQEKSREILVKLINSQADKSLKEMGFKHLRQVLEFVKGNGAELRILDLRGFERVDDQQFQELIHHCPHIHRLLMTKSIITDGSLAGLAEMEQLTSINFSKCGQITDAGLVHVAKMEQLTSIDFSDCLHITDDGLAHLVKMKRLTSINFSECCKITEAGLIHMAKMKQLTSINFRGCYEIAEAGLVHVAKMEQLTSIDFSGCFSITDVGLAHLENMEQLTSINFSSCPQITDDGLAHLVKMKRLTSINFIGCWMITDAGLLHLAEMKQLTSINFGRSNEITDAGLAHISKMEQLTSINFGFCGKITDAGLVHVAKLKQLTSIDFSGCQITNAGLAHLSTMEQLTSINFSLCRQITDAGLAHLVKMERLTNIDFSWCDETTDAGLDELRSYIIGNRNQDAINFFRIV